MFRTRPVDQWLARLSTLTRITDRPSLLELGRIVDDVVTAPAGQPLLADWVGASYAVAVVGGAARRTDGRRYGAGDVFVTQAFETVSSEGAVVLIGTSASAGRLRELLDSATAGPSIRRQPVTPAMSSSAAAYGSS